MKKMKHPKRKTFDIPIPDNFLDKDHQKRFADAAIDKTFDKKWMLLETEAGKFGCITYSRNGNNYGIPEPHPVVVYFNIAQNRYREIENAHQELLEATIIKTPYDGSKMIHAIYSYMAVSSSFAVFLFMACESLLNTLVPRNFVYKKPSKKNIVVYTAQHIQQMEFKEKLKDIIPFITKKSYLKEFEKTEWQTILKLKTFRDELVHTKKNLSVATQFNELIKTSVDFDFEAAIFAVKNFINYHHDGLIEDCPCGEDF